MILLSISIFTAGFLIGNGLLEIAKAIRGEK
jgi:hypothetical protein